MVESDRSSTHRRGEQLQALQGAGRPREQLMGHRGLDVDLIRGGSKAAPIQFQKLQSEMMQRQAALPVPVLRVQTDGGDPRKR
jgi:hypothetical protein